MTVRFLHAGDAALVVEFGDRIDREVNEQVLRLSARVRAARIIGVVETVPTFRSLMVLFDPLVTDGASLAAEIEGLEDIGDAPRQATLWRIPACYEAHYAPDLAEVAQRTGLTVEDVVARHVGTRFNVYMVGFVPGFPYMGDLPRSLALPRRTDPRVKVPAGSIAIAANMTAIYPVESPGGWHLIGATPARLFDLRAARPALLSPGDEVAFDPITADEYETIRAAVAADAYRVPSEALST